MKRVLITGATSGIGLSLAKHYAANGHLVYACGRNEQALNQLVIEHHNITPLVFDITDKAQVTAAAKQVEDLDILILNAGDCRYIDDPVHFDDQLFDHIIDVNLKSMATMLSRFLPILTTAKTNASINNKENRQVVFVSSSASLVPFPKAQAYGASKAGVDYLARSLAVDLAKHHIDVTLVHPGFIKTPLTDKNDFDMPFLISSEQAAHRIYQGVAKHKSYLHFPKRLTCFLHLFSLLPTAWWQAIAASRLSK
ncbi:SDR family NAD(P)-dependent oxidoreductase [Thalassotalea sp. LPB0316]|uniref:SDR family NAD(P)-dependent oxidoreductase n=1 Tax=Thalassotalea sp. LPB0316 TaxID=2769490 RepID=UPI0018674B13|nr:SDR family NAD(P)-dependent oxidoreductase [Thalassotalea sp. LPB0316]QOL27023.1 SDR family NAD(P)-dependent oxidoreductase [Thalassotalea sp. LPB0316]